MRKCNPVGGLPVREIIAWGAIAGGLMFLMASVDGCTVTRTVEKPVAVYQCPAIPTVPKPEDLTTKLPATASIDVVLKACGATIDNYSAALKACDENIIEVNDKSKASK